VEIPTDSFKFIMALFTFMAGVSALLATVLLGIIALRPRLRTVLAHGAGPLACATVASVRFFDLSNEAAVVQLISGVFFTAAAASWLSEPGVSTKRRIGVSVLACAAAAAAPLVLPHDGLFMALYGIALFGLAVVMMRRPWPARLLWFCAGPVGCVAVGCLSFAAESAMTSEKQEAWLFLSVPLGMVACVAAWVAAGVRTYRHQLP